jgi:hypothetical protein
MAASRADPSSLSAASFGELLRKVEAVDEAAAASSSSPSVVGGGEAWVGRWVKK